MAPKKKITKKRIATIYYKGRDCYEVTFHGPQTTYATSHGLPELLRFAAWGEDPNTPPEARGVKVT